MDNKTLNTKETFIVKFSRPLLMKNNDDSNGYHLLYGFTMDEKHANTNDIDAYVGYLSIVHMLTNGYPCSLRPLTNSQGRLHFLDEKGTRHWACDSSLKEKTDEIARQLGLTYEIHVVEDEVMERISGKYWVNTMIIGQEFFDELDEALDSTYNYTFEACPDDDLPF